MKAGICVSTVSIVCIVTEACPIEHGPIKIEAIFVVADVIGQCERRTHPDDPASAAAFTTEGNLDTQAPTGRKVCAPQAATGTPLAGVLNTCSRAGIAAHTHHIKKCEAG